VGEVFRTGRRRDRGDSQAHALLLEVLAISATQTIGYWAHQRWGGIKTLRLFVRTCVTLLTCFGLAAVITLCWAEWGIPRCIHAEDGGVVLPKSVCEERR
jgi:hypothetical protein